jgi:hypothetical protein
MLALLSLDFSPLHIALAYWNWCHLSQEHERCAYYLEQVFLNLFIFLFLTFSFIQKSFLSLYRKRMIYISGANHDNLYAVAVFEGDKLSNSSSEPLDS